MERNSIHRIARAAIAVALLSLISACTIVPSQSLRSEESLARQNQVAANDYSNRCGEQARLLKHEIALCRSVPIITAPLQ